MTTIVYPPPFVGRTRTVQTVKRPLTAVEANTLGVALAKQHIPVAVSVDKHRIVHLWPWLPLTTEQEVAALRAFVAKTDARLVWHKAAGR